MKICIYIYIYTLTKIAFSSTQNLIDKQIRAPSLRTVSYVISGGTPEWEHRSCEQKDGSYENIWKLYCDSYWICSK